RRLLRRERIAGAALQGRVELPMGPLVAARYTAPQVAFERSAQAPPEHFLLVLRGGFEHAAAVATLERVRDPIGVAGAVEQGGGGIADHRSAVDVIAETPAPKQGQVSPLTTALAAAAAARMAADDIRDPQQRAG